MRKRKRRMKLNQNNNTEGKKGRMLRSDGGDGGFAVGGGRIIIWLPLPLSHYSLVVICFFIYIPPLKDG